MNMFRDLAILALLGCGVAFMVSDPSEWEYVGKLPPQVTEACTFLHSASPFSSIVFFCLALALFMTRIKY
jgi:hypothetical protein